MFFFVTGLSHISSFLVLLFGMFVYVSVCGVNVVFHYERKSNVDILI